MTNKIDPNTIQDAINHAHKIRSLAFYKTVQDVKTYGSRLFRPHKPQIFFRRSAH